VGRAADREVLVAAVPGDPVPHRVVLVRAGLQEQVALRLKEILALRRDRVAAVDQAVLPQRL